MLSSGYEKCLFHCYIYYQSASQATAMLPTRLLNLNILDFLEGHLQTPSSSTPDWMVCNAQVSQSHGEIQQFSQIFLNENLKILFDYSVSPLVVTRNIKQIIVGLLWVQA